MTTIPSVAKVKQVVLFLSVLCVLSCSRYVADWGDASGQEEKEVFSPTLDIPDISGTEIPSYTILRTSESYGLEKMCIRDRYKQLTSIVYVEVENIPDDKTIANRFLIKFRASKAH